MLNTAKHPSPQTQLQRYIADVGSVVEKCRRNMLRQIDLGMMISFTLLWRLYQVPLVHFISKC